MLTRTKVFNGPFNVVFLADTVEKFSLAGILKDSLSLTTEPQSEDLEDGSKDHWGNNLKGELTFSEVDLDDIAQIADASIDTVEITFPAKSRKITISNPTNIIPAVDGLKTKITIEKNMNIGADNLGFSVASTSV